MKNVLDNKLFVLYSKYKLVRFTGVPLNTFSGVWRLNKNKNSGLKQTNVPHGWARISERRQRRKSLFSFDCSEEVQAPSLAFVRSGWVLIDVGKAYVVGQYGYYWSRVAPSASVAHDLSVYPTEVYPSDSNYRWDGFPLRCLYLGSV